MFLKIDNHRQKSEKHYALLIRGSPPLATFTSAEIFILDVDLEDALDSVQIMSILAVNIILLQ